MSMATPEFEANKFEQVACPKCGSHAGQTVVKGRDYLYGVPGEYSVSECQHCKFWFQNPRPGPEQLTTLYPATYLPHLTPVSKTPIALRPTKARYLQQFLKYNHLRLDKSGLFNWLSYQLFNPYNGWSVGVDLVPEYVPQGKLLEIGCGNGTRLLGLRHLGWQALYGIELVPAAAEQAQAEGFSVKCDPVEEVLDSYPDQFFDAIVSSMVLEHLYNPFEVVRQIAAKLKPGGQFLFSTISRDALDAKLYGPYWAGFDFPRHMVYLRKSDIYTMLADQFDQVECFHQAAPIDFVRSSTWRRDDGKVKPVDRLVLALGTSLPSRLISLILAWLGLTCRVSFRCRRKISKQNVEPSS